MNSGTSGTAPTASRDELRFKAVDTFDEVVKACMWDRWQEDRKKSCYQSSEKLSCRGKLYGVNSEHSKERTWEKRKLPCSKSNAWDFRKILRRLFTVSVWEHLMTPESSSSTTSLHILNAEKVHSMLNLWDKNPSSMFSYEKAIRGFFSFHSKTPLGILPSSVFSPISERDPRRPTQTITSRPTTWNSSVS